MRELADQTPHRLARQSRIRIERDDVAHTGRDEGRLTVDADEGGIRGAAQQSVQLVQLAPLAFPAHPLPLSFAPHATAVKQVEALTFGRGSMTAIQPCDSVSGDLQERVVALDTRGGGVGPVGQQCEMNFTVRRSQIVHFETLDLRLDGFRRRQQRRHDDHGSQVRGNTALAGPGPATSSRRIRA